LTRQGTRRLDSPCGEQGKLPAAKAFTLAERDKFMSEQEKSMSFMQELDLWGDASGARFQLGQIVATPGALAAISESGERLASFLKRHVSGDWGDIAEEDRQENELSVAQGFRLLSAYRLSDGTKLWIITEADRSFTTLLLPSEY